MRAFSARYASVCGLCEKDIARGELIVKGAPLDDGGAEVYQHAVCAQQARQKHLIASGQTFASQKPSEYRRKPAGPGGPNR